MTARFALFLLWLTTTPTYADIPTIDGAMLSERAKRDETTRRIKEVDRNRYVNSQSVTCSVYRSGRKNDPVGAAKANPTIAGMVRRIAREEGINENQFLALVYQESRFNPCAKSGAGAMGLAQLMPGTASDLGVNPHDIEQNLRGGARYFKQQLRRYNGNISLALAAYNAGPGRVDQYDGIPPFRETQGYVHAITQKWLPAFGGSDKSGIPLNYGGGSAAFEGARNSTLKAMALSGAMGKGSADVISWLAQLGAAPTGTIQDSWDKNASARNANIEMLNRMILLNAAFADLANSRNAMTLGDMAGANRSGRYEDPHVEEKKPVAGFCDERQSLVWNAVAKACVRELHRDSELQLTPE